MRSHHPAAVGWYMRRSQRCSSGAVSTGKDTGLGHFPLSDIPFCIRSHIIGGGTGLLGANYTRPPERGPSYSMVFAILFSSVMEATETAHKTRCKPQAVKALATCCHVGQPEPALPVVKAVKLGVSASSLVTVCCPSVEGRVRTRVPMEATTRSSGHKWCRQL